MVFLKKRQKGHTYTLDGLIRGGGEGGLYPGGLISGIIYSLANGWAYIRGGLKTWGGLKSGILRYAKHTLSILYAEYAIVTAEPEACYS